jgi:hypothetical protein
MARQEGSMKSPVFDTVPVIRGGKVEVGWKGDMAA